MRYKQTQIFYSLCEVQTEDSICLFVTAPGEPPQLEARDRLELFELKQNFDIFFKPISNE